jgi:inosine/xanthosine triphosphatase
MKSVIVASKNPVKLQAAQEGFARIFPEEEFSFGAVEVPSGVASQPFTARETLQGALNRALAARRQVPGADFWVGIEGGVEEQDAEALPEGLRGASLAAFAWVVVLDARQAGKGSSGTFYLPPQVADLVRSGKELGEADDIVFGRENSKQANGAVGLLSGDALDRAGYYEQAVLLALIPFRNPRLYEP